MRNLKRALSLALASVMLLGMMVVGTSAASYPDVDDNDNVEAIEVLNAVNVMIGRQGNFEPDEAVNRHEMAVIMAKLVLGVETADNYVGSHPFTDVVPWADKYVAACYENGLVAGTSATTYGGSNPLTAVQAAAMMLRALGYKDLNKGYQGDWRAPITAKANEIRLFSGVAANPNEKLNRNQVAQLALNTLKSPMVTMTDGTFNVTSGEGNVVISGGSRKYEVIARKDAYATAISSVETEGTGAEGIKGFVVELGEHLYNGKLKLTNDIDDFGRPARKWEYDGKLIGLYAKTELLAKEYVGKVTGKDLYDLLGSSTIDKYDLLVEIDGVEQDANAFRALMSKNNKAAVGATGTGVVTEVYTDSTGRGTIYIAIINTYLAQASKDYDAKKEALTVTVYGVKTVDDNFVKDISASGNKKGDVELDLEDFPIVKDMKKDDFMLVNVAEDEVVIVSSVEILEGVQISSFKSRDNVTVNGQKYNFASAAFYDFDALRPYTTSEGTINLKDTTYNIYLDEYDNLIGIKEVEAKKNYVFIAGIDSDGSNIANKTGKARALFLDGTSEVIEFNAEKSKTNDNPAQNFSAGALVNTWCTYTKNSSNVYTLTEVAAGTGGKLGQYWDTTVSAIDKQHITVQSGASTYAYGNKDSVYLTAKLGNVTTDTPTTYGIISGVDNVTVNAEKASLSAWTKANAYSEYKKALTGGSTGSNFAYGVYSLFNDKGVIIAAVVVGEDSGAAKNLVYAHTSSLEQEAYGQSDTRANSDEWTWTRKVIKDGEEILLTEKGDSSSYLEKMVKGRWYEVKMNSDGNVIGAEKFVVSESTDKDVKLEMASLGTKTKFVDDYKNIGNTVKLPGVETVLYSERFTSAPDGTSITHSGRTLFVTKTQESGFLVHEDAKIILQQYDRNTQETYLTEYTADQLDSLVLTMNDRGIKDYEYQVNAILEKGVATSVVINSEITDWTGKPTTPTGKDDFKSGTVVVYLDKAVSGKNVVASIVTNDILLDFDASVGAVTGTFAYTYEVKNAEGVVITSGTRTDGAVTATADPNGNYTEHFVIGSGKITSQHIASGKDYTVTISNIVPATYRLTAATSDAKVKLADVTVTGTTAAVGAAKGTVVKAGSNLALKIASGSVKATQFVNVTFTVTGIKDGTDAPGLATGVTGSNGTYTASNVAVGDLTGAGIPVLQGIVPNGEVVVTVKSVVDASSNVGITVVPEAGSEKYVTIGTATPTTGTANVGATQVTLDGVAFTVKASDFNISKYDYYFVTSEETTAVAHVDSDPGDEQTISGTKTIDIPAATVGTPIEVKLRIVPTEYTSKSVLTTTKLSGTAVADTSIHFDKDGYIIKDEVLFGTGTEISAGTYEVIVNGGESKYITLSAAGTIKAGEKQFQVPVADLEAGKDIEIKIYQAYVLTGEVNKTIRKGETITVDGTGKKGTGFIVDDNGTKKWVKYGDEFAPNKDTAVEAGYVNVTVTVTGSNAFKVTGSTGSTAATAAVAGTARTLFVKVGEKLKIECTVSGSSDPKVDYAVTYTDGSTFTNGTGSLTGTSAADTAAVEITLNADKDINVAKTDHP